MNILSALLTLSVAAGLMVAAQIKCPNPIYCPCGSTDKNITICAETGSRETEPCRKWARCKSCQEGLNKCLQCEDGFEGHLCNTPIRSRYCPNLNSPKLGSIRCTYDNEQKTCIGKCLPGFNFENHESEMEITLECKGSGWAPISEFPRCKSGGHCDLTVQDAGSFNCTTGMRGTWCDVKCANRYSGRFHCYPGRRWDPPLPRCVRPKVTPDTEVMCPDPGQVANGDRLNPDGRPSVGVQQYRAGQSVYYTCHPGFALQRRSLISCLASGTWSSGTPHCIPTTPVRQTVKTTAVPQEVTCPDPGQVANADRLDPDGRPSVGVQEYTVGQFVVYTCRPGFALQSRSLISCLPSGAWSSETPHCTSIIQPSPPSLIIRTTTANLGTVLVYCQDLGVDPNGSRQPRLPQNQRGFPQGSRVEYNCNNGYDMSGESSIFCLTSGEWSASRPKCNAQSRIPDTGDKPMVYCLHPGTIANGQVAYYPSVSSRKRGEPQVDNMDPEYPEGSGLQYFCDNGYSLEGRDLLICGNSGFWSAETPVCRRAVKA